MLNRYRSDDFDIVSTLFCLETNLISHWVVLWRSLDHCPWTRPAGGWRGPPGRRQGRPQPVAAGPQLEQRFSSSKWLKGKTISNRASGRKWLKRHWKDDCVDKYSQHSRSKRCKLHIGASTQRYKRKPKRKEVIKSANTLVACGNGKQVSLNVFFCTLTLASNIC